MILLICLLWIGYLFVVLIFKGILGIENRRGFVELIFIILNKCFFLKCLFILYICNGVLLFLKFFLLLMRMECGWINVFFNVVFNIVVELYKWFYFCSMIRCWFFIGIIFLCLRIINVLNSFIFCWLLIWEWY